VGTASQPGVSSRASVRSFADPSLTPGIATEYVTCMSGDDNRWTSRCAIWICVLGAAWRLLFYLYNKNLWLDEAMLSINILHRGFIGLCLPLEFGQMAPIGFLWLAKMSVLVLGEYDPVLRLPELLAGCLAIFVFYKLVKVTMPDGGAGALFALALFVLNRALIDYGCQVKPYEFDALASALLLLTAARLLRRWRYVDLFSFAAVAAVAPWFSYTSCFVFGAAGAVIALQTRGGHRSSHFDRRIELFRQLPLLLQATRIRDDVDAGAPGRLAAARPAQLCRPPP